MDMRIIGRILKGTAFAVIGLLALSACKDDRPWTFVPDQAETPGGETADGTFTVSFSSYNVLGTYTKAAWEPRQEAVRDIIVRADHDPDVIAFQECQTEPIKSSLPAMLSRTYAFHVSGESNCDSYLVAWKKDKFTLVEGDVMDMLKGNEAYDGKSNLNRFAHWVRLRDNGSGQDFLVYDIHVKTNGTNVSYQQLRYDCISSLCPATKFRAKQCGGIPVVILGDFNNYMDTMDGDIISAPAACKKGGFSDAAARAKKVRNLKYKTSGIDMETGKVTAWTTKDSRIDFVFVDAEKGFEVSAYQTVMDFAAGSDSHVNLPVPSDHHPVNATIRFTY